MPLNVNTVIIEFDVADVRELYIGGKHKICAGGTYFDKKYLSRWTGRSVEIGKNTCNIRINAAGGKAIFCFGVTTFTLNLHHVERIYEKETKDVIWQKGSPRHIVIQFERRVALIEKPVAIGSAVFFDAHNGIDTSWIEKCNGKLWQNQFIMLKPLCNAHLSNNVVVIHIDSEEVRIPTGDLVEVYEKETGRRIWPIVAKANP